MSVGLYLALQVTGDNAETLTLADGNSVNATPYQITALEIGDAGAYLPDAPAAQLPYTTTTLAFTMDITGASQNAVLASLADLQRVLSRADYAADGYELSNVCVLYSPPGSTNTSAAAPNSALILAPAGDAYVNAGADWVRAGSAWQLRGVAVAFVRVAAWSLPNNQSFFSFVTWQINGQTTINLSFGGIGAPAFPSPLSLTLTAGETIIQTDMLIATTTVAERVRIVDANSHTSTVGSNWTTFAQASARGGNTLRCTPTQGATKQNNALYTLSWTTPRRALDVYCLAAVPTGPGLATLQVAPTSGANEVGPYTRPVIITMTPNPPDYYMGLYYLGRIQSAAAVPAIDGFRLWVKRADGTQAVTVEIDSFLIVAADDPVTSVRRVYNPSRSLAVLSTPESPEDYSWFIPEPSTLQLTAVPNQLRGVGAGSTASTLIGVTGTPVIPFTGSQLFVTTYGRGSNGSPYQFGMIGPNTLSGTAHHMIPTAR